MAVKYISVKQLAAAFGIHVQTMRKELKMIKGLKAKKNLRLLNVKQQKIVYSELGNPFKEMEV